MTGRRRGFPVLALVLFAPLAAAGQTPAPTPAAEEIVARLMEANRQRDARLAGYRVERRYLLKNELYSKDGRLEVEAAFEAPDRLTFTTRSQQGSGMLNKRVFGRMMEGEQESLSPENKRRSAMTPENYDFRLAGEERVEGRRAYKLEITPRREDTFLFAGTIWVDVEDFAVVRATGRPAKRPSFWTRKIDFIRTFKKVGPFWLPARTESVTEVFLFGTSWATIENGDYRVRLQPAGNAPPQ
jgi:hypothetical protein